MEFKQRKTDGVYDRTWLEKARKMQGLKQYEVAEKAQISAPFYQRIEMGLQLPNVKMGIRITNALGLSPQMWVEEQRIA